jgi:hypothetical protein
MAVSDPRHKMPNMSAITDALAELDAAVQIT